MAASQAHIDRARVVADFLFPGRTPYGVTDLRGEHWPMTGHEPAERVAGLPQRTVAAFASALQERHDEGLIDVVAKVAIDWIGEHHSEHPIERVHARRSLRDLGSDLAFLTVVDAVIAVAADTVSSRHYLSSVWHSLQDVGSMAEAGLAGIRIPPSGAIGLPARTLRTVRAYVFGWLLIHRGIAPDARLSPRVVALLEQHVDAPARIASVVAERGTLDPDVLAAVLRSPVPVLAEGTL